MEHRIDIDGARVDICITVDDAALAGYLASLPGEERPDAVTRILCVGTRGIATMGMAATSAAVGEEVGRVLAETTDEAERRVLEILDTGRRTLGESLDPAVRDSLTARTVREFESLQDSLAARLDPDNNEGHTGKLLERLSTMLGPGGDLERSIRASLDPDTDESGLGRLRTAFEQRFAELRDTVVADQARTEEAERGTAKGVDYEARVDVLLRREALRFGGAIVEATGTTTGHLTAESKVGDFVVTLADGRRIVVEAKNTGQIPLSGKGGILDELDRAMTNRQADFAVCITERDGAFPAEVGSFAIYDNRVLVCDEGSGTLLGAALRWAAAALAAAGWSGSRVDTGAVADRLARMRELAQRISGAKRSLASVRNGVDQLRNDLDGLRSDLLDAIDDAIRELGSTPLDDARVA